MEKAVSDREELTWPASVNMFVTSKADVLKTSLSVVTPSPSASPISYQQC